MNARTLTGVLKEAARELDKTAPAGKTAYLTQDSMGDWSWWYYEGVEDWTKVRFSLRKTDYRIPEDAGD